MPKQLKKMAFVAPYQPTNRQEYLARKAGYDLRYFGIVDSNLDAALIARRHLKGFEAICTTDQVLALKVVGTGIPVGLFVNADTELRIFTLPDATKYPKEEVFRLDEIKPM